MDPNEQQYVFNLIEKPDEELIDGFKKYQMEQRKLNAKEFRNTATQRESERLHVVNQFIGFLTEYYQKSCDNIKNQENRHVVPQQCIIKFHHTIAAEHATKAKPIQLFFGDILLKITLITIGGSSSQLSNKTLNYMYDGDLFSHEFMGVIDQVGDGVYNLTVGQRVVVAFNIACGSCEYCQRQEYSLCDNTRSSELHQQKQVTQPEYSYSKNEVLGEQPEYIRVPFADINCLPIPDDVSDEKALFLTDIIPTAYHGCRIGNVKPGSTVAIWGLGPVGLLQARWCQILGAQRIIGIDYIPQRLKIAHQHLQIETINVKEGGITKKLLEMIPGGVDCSLQSLYFSYKSLQNDYSSNATANEGILTEMIKCTKKSGNIAITANYNNGSYQLPIGLMMEKNLSVIVGQSDTQKHWQYCLEQIRSAQFDPTFIITHSFNINSLPNFNEQLMYEETLKCCIRL